MEDFIYNSISKYFSTVSMTGYVKNRDVNSLLILLFSYHLLYEDYRGYVSQEDYNIIEKALNCLYGTNCLIPYPNYLKMNKLHLGSMTEMAQRVKTLENTPVLKLIHDTSVVPDPQSDILIVEKDGDGEVIVGSL